MRNRSCFRNVFWVTLFLSAGFMGTLWGGVRVKPHLYLGGGLGILLDAEGQQFTVEDDYDQYYFDMNYEGNKRAFGRGQLRVNLLEVDRFSIGYTFWGHYRGYPSLNSNFWVKKDKSYPFSDDLNFHGATLQWDLRYPVVSAKFILPFLLVGAGWFYGSSKSFQYEVFEIEGIQYYYPDKKIVTRDKEYSGTAWLCGGGLVLLRYAYVYVGMMDFGKSPVPIRRVLDCVIGIRI